jgi:hypothetical protein
MPGSQFAFGAFGAVVARFKVSGYGTAIESRPPAINASKYDRLCSPKSVPENWRLYV